MWQDWSFTVGSWIFIFSFIPSFIKKQYPAIGTSVITGMVLLSFSFAYLSLELRISMASVLITSICWFVMALLKLKEKSGV
jgi:hypothetical protein